MPEPTIYRQRLTDRVAIVTGAGAEGDEIGIGRAIAYVLAREEAAVMCVDLDLDRACHSADQIRQEGGRASAMAADVSVAADCAGIVAATVEQFGRLDVLVNNVGISPVPTLESIELDLWHKVLDTNLTSVMLMSKYAVPAIARSGGGSIVNISSIAGIRAMGAIAYGPAKAAMAQLSREIGVLHGRQGIRVNTVAPGHMMTPHAMGKRLDELSKMPASMLPAISRETRRKVSPLGVEGDAWDIAMAVLFLANDESRFINGVHLAVDGGVVGIGALTGHAFVTEP